MTALLNIGLGIGAFIAAYAAYMLVIAIIPMKSVPEQRANDSRTRAHVDRAERRQNVRFEVDGISIDAWLYLPDDLGSPVPCVVMAHGLGGTKSLGLDAYAVRFQEAGIAALAFDYRHLGGSAGEPRQLVWIPKQLEDFEAAVAYVRDRDEIDASRIGLWGSSLSGGHVITTSAADDRIACVSAQVPLLGGHSGSEMELIRKYGGIGFLLRMGFIHGLRDLVRSWLRLSPHKIPLFGVPGTVAAMPLADAWRLYSELAPDGFVNEVCARILLRMDKYAPIRRADRIRCPVLLQICDKDIATTPPGAVEKARKRLGNRAEIVHYPIDHFDIYLGKWFERAVSDQLAFFRKHLLAGIRRDSGDTNHNSDRD